MVPDIWSERLTYAHTYTDYGKTIISLRLFGGIKINVPHTHIEVLTDGWTDRQMDDVKKVHPPTLKFAGIQLYR